MKQHWCVIFSWSFPWLSPHILLEDLYIRPKVVELPFEVAKRITLEEQVTDINVKRLQEVVDKWLCLAISVSEVNHLLDQKDAQHLRLDKQSVQQEFVKEWCSLIGHLVVIILVSKFSILVCMMIIQSNQPFFGVIPFSANFDINYLFTHQLQLLPSRRKFWGF
jgi:hypothetical protein